MSSIYVRGKTWYVAVPTRSGKWTKWSTGSRDKAMAQRMARMIDDLGPKGQRAWVFLDAVSSGQLPVAALYDAYSTRQLDQLKEELTDVDLEPYVDKWLKAIESNVAADTIQHYGLYARSLIREGTRFPRSALRHERIVEWLGSRKVGRSTKRKYHAALSSFCEHLKGIGILQRNPMRDVKAPSPAPARMSYLEMGDVKRLIDAQEHPYNVLSALLHGTGMELSVALALTKRDIDPARREIRAKGTKTKYRDRHATVVDWAWPMIERHIALLTPNAPLFPGINRWTASDKHREACKALGLEDYQLKDSRHTYAVRAIRGGASFEFVARQLGHADTTMAVKVYGRFTPTDSERTDWEQNATAQDAARAQA